jgi:hypothetical protein
VKAGVEVGLSRGGSKIRAEDAPGPGLNRRSLGWGTG